MNDVSQPLVQPTITPSPVNNAMGIAVAQKVGDVSTKGATTQTPLIASSDQKQPEKFIRSSFGKTLVLFLVVLPVVTGAIVFGMKLFSRSAATNSSIETKKTQIDPSKVVTPELLPIASNSAETNSSWGKVTFSSAKVSFELPAGWQKKELSTGGISVTASQSAQSVLHMTFETSEKPVTTQKELESFLSFSDQQSALRVQVASQSASFTATGLPVITRSVARGNSAVFTEAFVGIDQKVVHLEVKDPGIEPKVIEQIIHSIAISSSSGGQSSWQTYSNNFGYTVQYPTTVTLRSSDKAHADQASIGQSTEILLFPTVEIQDPSGFANSLSLKLSDTQPTLSLQQTATRDFGEQEFKVYETDGEKHFVGQLTSGNWLEVVLHFDSSLTNRELLEQVIGTIAVKSGE